MILTAAFDKHFESLPKIEPLRSSATGLPADLMSPFRYPINKNYLGFTGVERRRAAQIVDWLRRSGFMPPPEHCSSCQQAPGAYHSENYLDIWAMCVVCSECHRKVHLRHRNPGAWATLVERFASTGTEWFAHTPLNPQTNFAKYVRQRFGPSYEPVHNALAVIPKHVRDKFPAHQLLPLDHHRL